jgi:hypothetical protein
VLTKNAHITNYHKTTWSRFIQENYYVYLWFYIAVKPALVTTSIGLTNLIEVVTKAGLTNLIDVVTKAGLTVT